MLLQPAHGSVFHEMDRDEATAAAGGTRPRPGGVGGRRPRPRGDGRRAAGAGRLAARPRGAVLAAALPARPRPALPGPALRRRRRGAGRRRPTSPRCCSRRPAPDRNSTSTPGTSAVDPPVPPHALHPDPGHAGLRPVAGRPAGAAGPPQPPARRRPLRQVQRPRRQARGRARTWSPACAARSARRAAWSARSWGCAARSAGRASASSGEDWFGFVFRVDRWSGTPRTENPEGDLVWVDVGAGVASCRCGRATAISCRWCSTATAGSSTASCPTATAGRCRGRIVCCDATRGRPSRRPADRTAVGVQAPEAGVR